MTFDWPFAIMACLFWSLTFWSTSPLWLNKLRKRRERLQAERLARLRAARDFVESAQAYAARTDTPDTPPAPGATRVVSRMTAVRMYAQTMFPSPVPVGIRTARFDCDYDIASRVYRAVWIAGEYTIAELSFDIDTFDDWMTANHIEIGPEPARALIAGSITASQIAAGSIIASRIVAATGDASAITAPSEPLTPVDTRGRSRKVK